MKDKNFEPLEKFLKARFPQLKITEKHKGNINVSEKDGFYLYNYNDTVLVPRDDPIIKLCRGLVVREDGKLMNFPFKRFFNYHESECDEVDIMNADILEKLDGSNVNCWFDGSNWRVTTRGSFYPNNLSDVNFEQVFKKLFDSFDKLVPGHTYMFELISKENRIVTHYDEEFVALIGIRDLDSLQELDQDHLDQIAANLGVRRPRRFNSTCIDDCRALFEQMRDDEEGLVVVDPNFNRFKLKQESYLKMSRIMKLKDQDILDYVLGKSEIDADFNKMPEVKDKINKINKMYNNFIKIVNFKYESIKGIKSQKEFALEALKYPFSSVLFHLRKGKNLNEYNLKYKQLDQWCEVKN